MVGLVRKQVSFSGVYAILYAFFDAEGRLDRGAMRRQVEASIDAGAHGIAALGLATEVQKLTRDERWGIMDWAAEDVAGRRPLAFTIFGVSVKEQEEEARRAAASGADWLIHQPPPERPRDEAALVDFFAAAIASHALPTAVQNAPAYLGYGLGPSGLAELRRRAPRFLALKGEGPAVEIAETTRALGPGFPVFAGRGGLEITDSLRAGCAGLIVAPDVVDHLAAIFEAMRVGAEVEAEACYRKILPAIVFVMQSLDTLIAYGKRLSAWRMGFDVAHDRAPALAPTPFGLSLARRFASELGPLRRAPALTDRTP